MKVREHQVGLSEDRKRVLLTPGYAVDIPQGQVKGPDGQTRSWQTVMEAAVAGKPSIYVLETGVFRASAYAVQSILASDGAVGTSRSDVGERLERMRDAGEAYTTQSGRAEKPADTDAPVLNDDSHLSPAKLAQLFGVPCDPLRTRLNRWRATNHTGWIENPDRGPREAKYLYRVGAVRRIIDAMRASREEQH